MTEEELIELLLGFVPEAVWPWLGFVCVISAVLSVVLPAPSANAHPLLKAGYKLVCVLGIGACKIRATGKMVKSILANKEGQ